MKLHTKYTSLKSEGLLKQKICEIDDFFESVLDQVDSTRQKITDLCLNSSQIHKIQQKLYQNPELNQNTIKIEQETKSKFDEYLKNRKFIKVCKDRSKYENIMVNLDRATSKL